MHGWEKIVWAVVVLVLIVLLIPLVFMQGGVLDLKARRRELVERQVVNRAVFLENRSLETEIRRLNTDPSYLEAIARRELGMVAHDEIVVKFHDTEGPDS